MFLKHFDILMKYFMIRYIISKKLFRTTIRSPKLVNKTPQAIILLAYF